jgi:PPOX class probable F420-dependent enzyme
MTALTSEVSEFITRARVGRLATADATGQPLVLPICYAFDGRVLYSAVDAKPKRRAADDLARIRNIRENPKVSLVIDEYGEDWSRLRWVILQGLADVVTTGGDFAAAADLLLSKYPQYRAMGLSREGGTMIRITPQKVLRWQYAN